MRVLDGLKKLARGIDVHFQKRSDALLATHVDPSNTTLLSPPNLAEDDLA